MKRSNITFATFILSSILLSTNLMALELTTRISGAKVAVYKLEKPVEITAKHDPSSILDSELVLRLEGILEGNTCGYKEIGLRAVQKESKDSTHDVYELELEAYNTKEDTLSLITKTCAQYASPTDFSVQVSIKPTSWGSLDDEQKWTYTIKNRFGADKILDVRISESEGWSWKYTELKPNI